MKDINTIICHKMLGTISEEDDRRLKIWLEESDEHRIMYQHLLKENTLVQRYTSFSTVDEKEAWKQFKKRNGFKDWRTYIMPVLHYAAVLFIPLLLLVSLWIVTENTGRPFTAQNDHQPFPTSSKIKGQGSFSNTPAKSGTSANGGPATWVSRITASISPKNSIATGSQASQASRTKQITLSNGTVVNLTTVYQAANETDGTWLTLEDGTRVHLNHGTSLIYPKHFDANNRTVRLDGEGYFIVAKETSRPFYVVTSSGRVKEYGTIFNVNTYTPGYTKVVLVEGSISLKANNGRETMVKPGELAIISENSPQASLQQVDVSPYIAWNNGQYVFVDTTLEDFMNVIGYWYGLNIHFRTEAAKEKRFSGSIDRKQDLTMLLHAVRKVTELNISLNDRDLIIE